MPKKPPIVLADKLAERGDRSPLACAKALVVDLEADESLADEMLVILVRREDYISTEFRMATAKGPLDVIPWALGVMEMTKHTLLGMFGEWE